MRILQANTDGLQDHVQELLGEYLEGVCSTLNRQFDAGLDHRSILEQDMAELDRFCAPQGRAKLGMPRFDWTRPAPRLRTCCIRPPGFARSSATRKAKSLKTSNLWRSIWK
jgi:hypothetical protein